MDKNIVSSTTTKALFENAEIRRERYQDERWFNLIDVIAALTEQTDYKKAKSYRTTLKNRLKNEWSEMVTDCDQLKFLASDAKRYKSDAANTKTLLRLIQSVPSSKAEPFKLWLASLGNQKMEELNDPELGMQRARETAIRVYQSRGMSDKEITQRLQMIDTRHDYTDELKSRGIKGVEYGLLTNTSYLRSGKDAQSYKEHKWLIKSDNLRDHMTKTEMLLTELSEETGLEVAKSKDAQWFGEIQDALLQWADVARQTREHIESKIWKSVLDPNNRLTHRQQVLRDKVNDKKHLWKNDL